MSELGYGVIIYLFSFQKYYVGRGLFLIFVAILCFDYVDKLTTFIGRIDLIVGIILLVYGVFLTAVGFVGDNEPLYKTST